MYWTAKSSCKVRCWQVNSWKQVKRTELWLQKIGSEPQQRKQMNIISGRKRSSSYTHSKIFQQWIAVNIIDTETILQKRNSKKLDRFHWKFWREKGVAVIGQDEVQCEFPIPSWRSSSTEHGESQRPEVPTTKRFEWRQHVLTSNANCPCSDKLQHLCRHLLLCSTDEWSGLRRNRNLHKTQLNLLAPELFFKF